MNCSPELKEVAAIGLGEMIALTDPPCLSHRFVSNFTGPLIRVLGDRYAPSLKTAVLHTLTLLLRRVSAQLKPFLPQLYSTFTRALADPHRGVRLHGAVVLGCLAQIYPKPANIVQELHTQVRMRTSFILFSFSITEMRSDDSFICKSCMTFCFISGYWGKSGENCRRSFSERNATVCVALCPGKATGSFDNADNFE